MALPDGFQPIEKLANRSRLLISTEGEPDCGKTEWALSAPVGLAISLDRGLDGLLRSVNPPSKFRQKGWGACIIDAPVFSQFGQKDKDEYVKYYKNWRSKVYAALDSPCKTVVIDGDSDSWELQRLAEFGTLTNVPGRPGIAYTQVNAARKVIYSRCYDAKKIVIATNKVGPEYAPVVDANGKVKMEGTEPVRAKTGDVVSKGFDDDNYIWQIRLRHLRNAVKREWGIRILRCKFNTELVGAELWGNDCNFRSLVELVFPDINPDTWYQNRV